MRKARFTEESTSSRISRKLFAEMRKRGGFQANEVRRLKQLEAGPARSPVFCGDFLHDLDLEITLGNQLLEPR